MKIVIDIEKGVEEGKALAAVLEVSDRWGFPERGQEFRAVKNLTVWVLPNKPGKLVLVKVEELKWIGIDMIIKVGKIFYRAERRVEYEVNQREEVRAEVEFDREMSKLCDRDGNM
jgi:hypothetical protein